MLSRLIPLCVISVSLSLLGCAHVKVTELEIEYRHMKEGGRNPMYQPFKDQRKRQIALDLGVQFGPTFFWSRVHGGMGQTYFRDVGWHFEYGLKLWQLRVGVGHHSQHTLDRTLPYKFPVEDWFFVRWSLLQ